jgi:hypothetical protein
MPDLVTIGGPLIGVVIGGVITFLVSTAQFRRQEAAARRREHLSRLENIHKALTDVDQGIVGMSGQAVMYSLTGKDFDSEQMKGGLRFNELRMLVDFYAPTFSRDVDAIGEHYRDVGTAVARAISTNGENEKKAAALKSMAAAQAARDRIGEVKKRLSEMARQYAEEAV